MDYLVRNAYGYSFRIRLPKALSYTRKELRWSLGTAQLTDARIKAKYLAAKFHQLFMELKRRMDLTEEQIISIIKEYKTRLFAQYDKPIMFGLYDEDIPPERQISREGEMQWTSQYRDWLLDVMTSGNYKVQIIPDWSGGEISVEQAADKALIEQGLYPDEIQKQSDEYSILCGEIIQTEIEGIDHYHRKLNGEINISTPTTETKQEATVTLGNMIQRYLEHCKTTKGWDQKAHKHCKSVLRDFSLINGADIPLSNIKRKTVVDFKNKLAKLPPVNRTAIEHRGKNILELLKAKHEHTLSIGTRNKRIGTLSTFLRYCMDEDELEAFSLKRLKIKENKKNSEKRDIFSKDDLNKIFHSEAFIQDKLSRHHQFWGPVLCLYTGARPEEISQLQLNDFIEQDGVPCIKVYPGEDEKTKTESSERLIPLHPFLVDDLKILNSVEMLKGKGYRRFLYTLTKTEDGYSRNLGTWFNSTFLKKIGVYVRFKKVLYSFRHTFSTNLYHNGCREADSNFLDGHAQHGVKFDTYVKKGTMSRLRKVLVDHLDYGIDLSHLKNSKYIVK